jgi:hypothetical protein
MDSLTLTNVYANLMKEAFNATSRRESINFIQKATKIREALEVAKQLEKR